MKRVLFSLGIVLIGCTTGYKLKKVDYGIVLNDKNSKVWILDQEIQQGINISSSIDSKKDLIIFFENGKYQRIPMKGVGKEEAVTGSYFVNTKEELIDFYNDTNKWSMHFGYFTRDSILLETSNKNGVDLKWKIKPLPML